MASQPFRFVEFTTYLPGSEVGYRERPTFDGDLWPIVLEGANRVGRVVFFCADVSPARGIIKRLTRNAAAFGVGAWDLGPMVGLEEPLRDQVNVWASQGHLNILLEVDLPLAATLGSSFEDVGFVTRDVGRLKLSDGAQRALIHLVERAAAEKPIVAFGFEGESLFVFGPESIVERFPHTTGGRG